MSRFFVGGYVVESSRETHHAGIYDIPIFVPSPQGLACLSKMVSNDISKYGKKDERYRVGVILDEGHEITHGDVTKSRRPVLMGLVDKVSRFVFVSATPPNLVNLFPNADVITRRVHDTKYIGYSSDLPEFQKLDFRAFNEEQCELELSTKINRLPSGKAFPNLPKTIKAQAVQFSLLEKCLLHMHAYPDYHVPGWRHCKVDAWSAAKAHQLLWHFCSVKELDIIGVEWTSETTKTDQFVNNKSSSRVFMNADLFRRVEAQLLSSAPATLENDVWSSTSLKMFPSLKAALLLTDKFRFDETSEGESSSNERHPIVVIECPGINMIDSISVVEQLKKDMDRSHEKPFNVRLLVASGRSNAAGVTNKSRGHSTMLTDEVILSAASKANPLDSSSTGTLLVQRWGRVCTRNVLTDPENPPIVWCNKGSEEIIKAIPSIANDLCRLKNSVSQNETRVIEGTLLQDAIKTKTLITRSEHGVFHRVASLARHIKNEYESRHKKTDTLLCKLLTADATDGTEHFAQFTQLNLEPYDYNFDLHGIFEVVEDSESATGIGSVDDNIYNLDARPRSQHPERVLLPTLNTASEAGTDGKPVDTKKLKASLKKTLQRFYWKKPRDKKDDSGFRHALEFFTAGFSDEEMEVDNFRESLSNTVVFEEDISKIPSLAHLFLFGSSLPAMKLFNGGYHFAKHIQEVIRTAKLHPPAPRVPPSSSVRGKTAERTMDTLLGSNGRPLATTAAADNIRKVLAILVEEVFGNDGIPLADRTMTFAEFVRNYEAEIKSFRIQHNKLAQIFGGRQYVSHLVRDSTTLNSSGVGGNGGWKWSVIESSGLGTYAIHNTMLDEMNKCAVSLSMLAK